MKRTLAACGLLLVVAACAGSSTSPSSTLTAVGTALPSSSATVVTTATPVAFPSVAPITSTFSSVSPVSPTPEASTRPACPNAHGGACLGALAPGTYTSLEFATTSVTYTVPAGWQNFEDLPGNLAFLPPGGALAGVDAGTSDSVGIAASVAVDSPDCAGLPAPGVARSASVIAKVLAKRPGLAVKGPVAVTIGGLRGFMLEIRLAKGWTKKACTGEPDVPLLVGVPPSNFADTVLGHLAVRMYLLDHGADTISIEIGDVSGGARIHDYVPFVESLKFGP